MPLTGVRVVELAQIIAGPVVGQVLAELGADVIKVERPEGDESRRWTPPVWFGAAPTFHGVNRSKRSVSLDLTTEEGRAGLLKLVRGADVFVQNLRPGVTAKLGLDPETACSARTRFWSIAIWARSATRGRSGSTPVSRSSSRRSRA